MARMKEFYKNDVAPALMKKFGYSKDQTLVIGDRLYTDIASGVNAGTDTVLVLSGEATVNDLENSSVKPTFVLNSIKDILDELNS